MQSRKDVFKLRINHKSDLNHNTFKITLIPDNFLLPQFTVSSFALIYTDDFKYSAPYTPLFSSETSLTFCIKRYSKGKMSNYIYEKSDFLYVSKPVLKLQFDRTKYKDILMLAGGTGITPMLQILQSVKNHEIKPHFTVFFCNLSVEDIFLKDELLKYKDFVKIIHVIENSEDRDVLCGRISKEYVENEATIEGELLFDFCYVCGPNGFMKTVCGLKNIDKSQGKLEGILKEIGFKANQVYKF